MTAIQFRVEKYSVSLSRALAWNVDGKGLMHTASIVCTGNGPHTLLVGFAPEGEVPAENAYDAGTKTGFLMRPASEFSWYIDVLRNENPVEAIIDDDRPVFNSLAVGPEPVGDGELQATARSLWRTVEAPRSR